ncbi:MAG: methionine adenosyltransferase [Proteobacteria bacterium]|nr:methionine adenosyltransferase [Pseudomonadota bacterium]
MDLIVSRMALDEQPVEMVERKGSGHPDSICDALAQTLSRSLCRHYLDRFGTILHHNVDKVLLCGGRSHAQFGGGEVLMPMELYLAGRATTSTGSQTIPVEELAIEGSRRWLRDHLHALEVDRHVVIHSKVRPGSRDLTQLFTRGGHDIPRANDTSIGIGYAPMSRLERLVLRIERSLNEQSRSNRPAWGEDTKVMAVRHGEAVSITIACAMIGRHLVNLDHYLTETAAVQRQVERLAAQADFAEATVRVNAADAPAAGSVYLTVTGISAEAGDDGEVGRGNRINGLITPYRPMSLEAAAGKNPVSHVGLLYNVAAREAAEQIVASLPEVARAECYLVSEIGRPVNEPAVAHLRLATHDEGSPAEVEAKAEEILRSALRDLPKLTKRLATSELDLF